MKKLFIFVILSFIYSLSFGQTKEIILSRLYHQEIPEGKVWVISNSKALKASFSDGVFRSGTACNAAFYSNPKYIYGISYYDNLDGSRKQAKTIGFTFKSIQKFDENIYLIQPHFFLKDEMTGSDLENSLKWKFRPDEIVFYPGMTVFPSSCLINIIVCERNMTALEIKTYQLRLAKINKIKQQISLDKKNDSLKLIEEQRQKFADLNASYTPYQITNINELKFNSNQKAAIIQSILGQLQTFDKSVFIDLIKNDNFISCNATWDSSGNVNKIQLSKISGRYGYDSYSKIELQLPELKLKELSEILKLNSSPEISFYNQTRKCNINADLFEIRCSVNNKIFVSFKKQKNTYKYYEGRFHVNKPAFEKLIDKNNLSTPNVLTEVYLYETKYTFIPASSIIESRDKTVTEGLFIIPAN